MIRNYGLIIVVTLFGCAAAPEDDTGMYDATEDAYYQSGTTCVLDVRRDMTMSELDELYRFCAQHHMIYLMSVEGV